MYCRLDTQSIQIHISKYINLKKRMPNVRSWVRHLILKKLVNHVSLVVNLVKMNDFITISLPYTKLYICLSFLKLIFFDFKIICKIFPHFVSYKIIKICKYHSAISIFKFFKIYSCFLKLRMPAQLEKFVEFDLNSAILKNRMNNCPT